MSASWEGLLQNLAILAILFSIWNHGSDWIENRPAWLREVTGSLVAGGGVILLMLVPFEFQPGITADLRYALIGLAGFLGSPLIGVAAGLAAAAYRIYLGGIGAPAGIISIAIATSIGIAGWYLLRGRRATARDLLIFAVAIALLPMAGSLVLPPAILLPMLATSAPPLSSMTFVATMLAGLAVIEAARRRETARANVFYRSIIDALPEPVNAKDLGGRFLAANPATARQVKAPDVAALIGKSDFDFFPPDIARGFQAEEERVLAAGEPETIEQTVTRDDGSRQWVSTLKAPLRDRNGTIIGLITHNHDITERKHMEDEIAEGRQRLNHAMEHMADGLVMYDREARIVLCNDRYRAMFPLTADLRVPGESLETVLRAVVERGEQNDIPEGAVDIWIKNTLTSLFMLGEHDIHLADGRWLSARTRPTDDGGALCVVADSPTEAQPGGADRTQPAAHQPRQRGRPDRPDEPPRLRRGAPPRLRAKPADRRAAQLPARRCRSLQGVQRHLRPPGRRPLPADDRQPAEGQPQAAERRGGALRRRGVLRDPAGHAAGGRHAARRERPPVDPRARHGARRHPVRRGHRQRWRRHDDGGQPVRTPRGADARPTRRSMRPRPPVATARPPPAAAAGWSPAAEPAHKKTAGA